MKKKFYRFTSLFIAINLIVEIFFPAISYALTSGPTQPEHVQFAPIGADNSVDLFSGDFSYNIPLFSLPGPDGGYPFNLTYQAGVGMEEEASWVGLGWNLTPGAINRQMRGLPDEFKGDGENPDLVQQELEKRPNITNALTLGGTKALEFFGKESEKTIGAITTNFKRQLGVGFSTTFRNNSYTGVGYSFAPSVTFSLSSISKYLGSQQGSSLGLSAKLGASLDSESGADTDLGINGSIGSTGEVQDGDGTIDINSREVITDIDAVPEMRTVHEHTIPKSYTTTGLSFNANLSYNSRAGLTGASFSLGLQGGGRYENYVEDMDGILRDRRDDRGSVGGDIGSGVSLSFVNNGYIPNIGIPMKVGIVSGLVKIGNSGLPGTHISPYANYTRIKQDIKDKDRKVPAYGYNHSEKNQKNDGIMDFNRENEGMIYPNTKTLPSPHLTYDTYMVTGQGMLGSFRPYRSEVLTLGDRKETSDTDKTSLGADLDVKLRHWGLNYDGVTGSSTSSRMALPGYDYKTATSKNVTYEPVFYKFQGEAAILPKNALSDIGGNVPLRFDLTTKGKPKKLVYSTALSKLEEAEAAKDDAEGIKATQDATTNITALEGKKAKLNKILYQKRAARNRVIIPIENQYADALPEYTVHYKDNNEGLDCGEEESDSEEIPEYKILKRTYEDYDTENPRCPYKPHHLAGFTCTSASGLRYVYGLPVYNFEQKETVKSVADNSDPNAEGKNYVLNHDNIGINNEAFKSIITTPSYASSYLLTSILGNDYIDVDTELNPGPSKADLGYWVKFYYERHQNAYQWRMPFKGANFTEGLQNTQFDDKVSFIEGKKELIYLNKVESKTHVAIFRTSARADAKSAAQPQQTQKRLDRIDIYTRIEHEKGASAVPLKSIHFEYEYNLCYGIPNGSAKLTLKKLYFTYQNKDRGGISPYQFDYHGEGEQDLKYDRGALDTWGTYTPPIQEGLNNVDFPYTRQNTSKSERDRYASAWNLSKITFPSGSTMNIFYESDDYSHVQDRTAMQMTKFEVNIDTDDPNDQKQLSTGQDNLPKNRIIYFPLDPSHSNIAIDAIDIQSQVEIANQYLDERDQVYFKTRIALRYDASSNQGKDYEDIEAYLDLEPTNKTVDEQDILTRGLFSKDGTTYTHGFFTVKETRQKGVAYHPLSAAAWIKLKNEHPRLINSSNQMSDTGQSLGDAFDLFYLMKSFKGVASIAEILRNYFKSARSRKWGRYIKPEHSFIRLNNVIGKKYGGGIRVKRIEFSQNGERTAENTYGQVYDYTTQENGKTISSGVASFEPSGAAEENPLRYVEKFNVHIPALPDYPLFSQFPVNEGYYPSPRVGYRKVTVKSIATAAKIEQANGSSEYEGLSFPTGISTTGVTIQEFYTYKDFPIISSHSSVEYEEDTGFGFGFGFKTTSHTGASQGYMIELNNMNGTPKSMYHYGQNDKGEVQYDKPISSSQYFYKTTNRQGKKAVDNLCSVLVKEKNGKIIKEDKLVGVEYEVFMDASQSITSTRQYGLNANVDFLKEPFNLPLTFGFGGMLKEMKEEVRTVVVNKIIYRSGILDSVRVSDGLSVSSTRNLLWDQNTGAVLLTSVSNNFEDRIYSYTIPAYTQYDEMGAAYRNIRLKFTTSMTPSSEGGKMYNATARLPRGYTWAKELVAGDELVVKKSRESNSSSESEEDNQMHRAIYMGVDKQTARLKFYIVPINGIDNPEGNLDFMIYRSGRRNLLGTSAGYITSLSDPTQEYNREQKIFSGKFNIKK